MKNQLFRRNPDRYIINDTNKDLILKKMIGYPKKKPVKKKKDIKIVKILNNL